MEGGNGKTIAVVITYSSVDSNLVSALSHAAGCFHPGYQSPPFFDNSFPLLLGKLCTRPSSVTHSLPRFPMTPVSMFSCLLDPCSKSPLRHLY